MISTKVKDYAHYSVQTISNDATIGDAAEKMFNYNIGALIVDEDGEHVGIFTERDFLKASYTTSHDKSAKVDKHCSKPMITIKETDTLGKATQKMLVKRIRRLPVVDESNKVVAFCSMRDILSATHNSFLSILDA